MKTSNTDYPRYRSHFLPRTRPGWIAALCLLALFALAEPPLVYLVANRTAPWLLGMPFLYAYLLVVYLLMIVVLLWAHRRGV